MRETRLSGSEGGGILSDSPYPYSDSFLSLLRVYALQACPSVGGGTAGRPCAGQKFSAQELLSIPSCARLHDSARLTVVDYFQYYRIWRRFNCQN